METRASPKDASTSYYIPPIGLRHLHSVSARNVVPPGGAKALSGVGVFFTLSCGNANASAIGNDDAREARSSNSDTKLDKSTATAKHVLYTSEVVRDTLNPDWAPFDDDLVNASGHQMIGRDSRSSLDGNFSPAPAPHLRMTLRVFFIPAPKVCTQPLLSQYDENVLEAFVCKVCLAELVSLPGGAGGERVGNLSASGVSGASASRAGAGQSAPPNTPLFRLKQPGAFISDTDETHEAAGDGLRSSGRSFAVSGRVHAEGGGVDPRAFPLNPHGGWVVPKSKAWPNLVAASLVAQIADDVSATETFVSLAGAGGEAGTHNGFVRDGGGASVAVKKATTRQISVANETIVDAAARLASGFATRRRLRMKVGGNLVVTPVAPVGGSTAYGELGRCTDHGERAIRVAAIQAARRNNETLLRAIQQKAERVDTHAQGNADRKLALRDANRALREARQRLVDANEVLAGPHGAGRLFNANQKLSTRRSRLVRDLARVFPVRNFGDETGDESLTQDGLDKETSELVDTDVMEDGSEETLGVSKTGPLTIAGVPLDHRFGATQGRQFNTNSLNGTADKKHNDQTQLLNDPEAAAAALGYVTQATLQLASILDVPLRYPVAPGASRSYICDLQQVFEEPGFSGGADGGVSSFAGSAASQTTGDKGTPNASTHGKVTERGTTDQNGTRGPVKDTTGPYQTTSRGVWRRVEFPLFAEQADGARFAYAVFLLNKDLEQLLNAQGQLAVGPRHTLQNLNRLLRRVRRAVSLDA